MLFRSVCTSKGGHTQTHQKHTDLWNGPGRCPPVMDLDNCWTRFYFCRILRGGSLKGSVSVCQVEVVDTLETITTDVFLSWSHA